MEEFKEHFWHIVLVHFKKYKNTTEIKKKNYTIYGEGTVKNQTCQK